jgi:hypothetical protein
MRRCCLRHPSSALQHCSLHHGVVLCNCKGCCRKWPVAAAAAAAAAEVQTAPRRPLDCCPLSLLCCRTNQILNVLNVLAILAVHVPLLAKGLLLLHTSSSSFLPRIRPPATLVVAAKHLASNPLAHLFPPSPFPSQTDSCADNEKSSLLDIDDR